MKAAQIDEYGDANKVIVREVEKPQIKPGYVLVKLSSSSLNPADSGIREGAMQQMLPMQLPFTLGGDIAGTVEQIGEDVKNVKPGDEVYGQAYALFNDSGAFADYALVAADHIALIPKTTDVVAAGSLPLVGISAVQAIDDHLQVKPEQKILIHGGAGSVGAMAIELAKHRGAYVATTVSEKDFDFVKSLGADEVINYKTHDFEQILKDFDGVVDLVADPTGKAGTFEKSLKVLRQGGTIVSLVAYAGKDAIENAKSQGYNAVYQLTKVNTDSLNQLSTLVDQKVITPRVAKKFPLSQITEAFKLRETTNPGKIVITM